VAALYAGPALTWGFRIDRRLFVDIGAGLGIRLLGETFVVEGVGPVTRHDRVAGKATLTLGIPLTEP